MHVAWAAFATPIASRPGSATAAAAHAHVNGCPLDVSRTVLCRQRASRPLPAAIADDTSTEARHVA
jgi:hypothetical protein